MAWAFTAVGTSKIVEGTDPSLDMTGLSPTGSGGILLGIIDVKGAASAFGTPTGWTEVFTSETADGAFACFSRLSDGGANDEPTFTVTGGALTTAAFISRWTGGNETLASLLNGTLQTATAGGSGSISLPEITPSVDNCLVIRGGHVKDDIGPATTYPGTLLTQNNINLVSDMWHAWVYEIQTTATLVSAGSITGTAGTNTTHGRAFALTAGTASSTPRGRLLAGSSSGDMSAVARTSYLNGVLQ